MQRTILCYGDSNTWGYIPPIKERLNPARYPRSIRWTGLLQSLLGEHYYIIEEGLNSRTTNLDYQVPPNRNGKTYLPSCLYSHSPINLVILFLGGNDLKIYFNRTPEQIRDGLAELVQIIKSSQYGHNMEVAPDILIISPPKIDKIAEKIQDENGAEVFKDAIKKIKILANLYAELAKQQNCYFMDISKETLVSNDGLHFDINGHKRFSHMVFDKIKSIYE